MPSTPHHPDAAVPVLAADERGDGPTLVLLHGFTQTGRCWGRIADDLGRDHHLVLVDAPGHGGSSAVVADLPAGARLLGERGGRATYVGYSMGGRFLLQLALDQPELVDRLVLVGASPGLDDPLERAQRRHADEELADQMGTLGLAMFLDRWLAQPLFAGLDESSRFLDERRTNTVEGLQSSLRHAGTGAQDSLWPRLAELTMPTLLVTGSTDRKFAAIAGEMVTAIGPNARHIVVPNAGHTAHLENPDAFLAAVRAWLRTTDSA